MFIVYGLKGGVFDVPSESGPKGSDVHHGRVDTGDVHIDVAKHSSLWEAIQSPALASALVRTVAFKLRVDDVVAIHRFRARPASPKLHGLQ